MLNKLNIFNLYMLSYLWPIIVDVSDEDVEL